MYNRCLEQCLDLLSTVCSDSCHYLSNMFCSIFFWMMHLVIYHLAEMEFSIKIYVSCLEPSFDFKGWWIEMSSLHHIYLVVIHNIVRGCTGCLPIDYFQSQRHLLTEKIYHSIRLWAHDFFVSASDHIDHPIDFPFMISLNKKQLGVCATVADALRQARKKFY